MNDQAKVPMNMDRGRAQSPRPRAEAIASAPRRGGAAKREPRGDPGARGHDRDDQHPKSGAGTTTTGFVHGDEDAVGERPQLGA